MMTLLSLQETYPSLVDPSRKWAILTAPQMEMERDQEHLKALKSPKRISPRAGLALTATGLNFLAAKTLGIRFYRGETVAHVCASGNHLLKRAREAILEGAQVVLLVTLNSMASVVRAAYHNRLGVISRTGVIRPFHRDRDGTIMADGLAVALVASSSLVQATGTFPLARIVAGGEMADSYHMYGLDPEGEAIQKAIEEALALGRILPEEVSLVKSHGTGTRQNDAVEAGVLKRVFSRTSPLVTALKPYFGHSVVSSALVELAHLLKKIKKTGEVIPIPTTSQEELDPCCQGLDLVLQVPRPFEEGYILSLASGFGGFNSAVVLEILP
jgi:3-oxoacyl-[acyl-carrier-protein] synthase II